MSINIKHKMARIEPTFFLKGIDPEKLIKDYQTGLFSRPVVTKNKLITINQNSIIAPIYSDDSKEGVFVVRDRHNIKIIIATGGHIEHDLFVKQNKYIGGQCKICMSTYDYFMPGYPILHEEHTVLNTDKKLETWQVFWCKDPNYCSFECQYYYLKNLAARSITNRDATSLDSIRLLKFLHKLIYPDAAPLVPSNQPELLTTAKGSLEPADWKDRRHTYIRTDRVMIIPAKTEFVRQQISTR